MILLRVLKHMSSVIKTESRIIRELAGEDYITPVQFWQAERHGRDREDKPDYKVKISAALCFHNRANIIEYYDNLSYLEHGERLEKAVCSAFAHIECVSQTKQQKRS